MNNSDVNEQNQSSFYKTYLEVNSSDSRKVQFFTWTPEVTNYKAVILLVHGMAEHIERYQDFSNFLISNNYIVYGYNQRGHKGTIESKTDYGYMGKLDNFKVLVEDLNQIVDTIRKKHPRLKIFLFGHSMGSFVTQYFIQEYPKKVEGVILSGSATQSTSKLIPGFILAGIIKFFCGGRHKSKLIDKIVFGSYNKKYQAVRTESDWLSRNNEEVDKYISDEYCGGLFSIAYYQGFFKGLLKINKNHHKIDTNLPILLVSGDMDPVGGYGDFTSKLYLSLLSHDIEDVNLKLYKDARHELLNEINKQEVMNDIITWLDDHLFS